MKAFPLRNRVLSPLALSGALFLPVSIHAVSIIGLGDLPGGAFYSIARGVSADGGTIVGESIGANSTSVEAFRWKEGVGMEGLGDLSGGSFNSQAAGVSADGSTVVGISSGASGFEAFRWKEGVGMEGLGDLPGGSFYSQAYGVSVDGSTVVGVSSRAGGSEAFRWTEGGGMQGLGDLSNGVLSSSAFGVSGDGSTVVGRSDGALYDEAFLWSDITGMVSLWSILQAANVDLSGWRALTQASAISSNGRWVVGQGYNSSGALEAFRVDLWSPSTGVPDSGTSAALLGVGLIGLALFRRRLAERT